MLVGRMLQRPPVDPALLRLRERLDRVNRDLLALVQERGELMLEAAALKDALGLGSYDPRREAEMLRALTAHPDGPFSTAELEVVFKALFAASLGLQRRSRAGAGEQPQPHPLPHIKAVAK
jgi:chorismate mutase-like protein